MYLWDEAFAACSMASSLKGKVQFSLSPKANPYHSIHPHGWFVIQCSSLTMYQVTDFLGCIMETIPDQFGSFRRETILLLPSQGSCWPSPPRNWLIGVCFFSVVRGLLFCTATKQGCSSFVWWFQHTLLWWPAQYNQGWLIYKHRWWGQRFCTFPLPTAFFPTCRIQSG